MAFDFRKSAVKSITVSPLMANREKISTQEIIQNYPDGITITSFDIIPNDIQGDYPVFVFAEDDSKFYTGGFVLKRIVKDWIAAHNDDTEKTIEDFENSGGIKIKLSMRGSLKNRGREYVAVEIL